MKISKSYFSQKLHKLRFLKNATGIANIKENEYTIPLIVSGSWDEKVKRLSD